MLRVLQVLPCLAVGGTEAFVMNLYRNTDRARVQFDFLLFREGIGPYAEEISTLGGRIFVIPPPKVRAIPQFLAAAVPLMRRGGYAAVHSHGNLSNAWVLLAARLAGIPARISHCHDMSGLGGGGLKGLYRDWELRLLKRQATVFLACSRAAGEYLYGREFFAVQGRVIGNGIAAERFALVPKFETEALREEISIPEDCDLILGNLTRFEPKKNPLFLLEVFAKVRERHPGALLILGGPDGGLLRETQLRAAALGLTESVRFVGCREDVPAFLHLLDVYVLPSLYEGLPIALLEAQAAGFPCVVSDAVSREVDLGLGGMAFLPLRAGAESWAAQILALRGKRNAALPEEIADALAQHGCDGAENAAILLEYYREGERGCGW